MASPKALGMTFLLFLLMYGVGALRAGRVLRRQSIQGLLTSRRANEVPAAGGRDGGFCWLRRP